MRLLDLLHVGWREWATPVARECIDRDYPSFDLVGDFLRFLLTVFTQFVRYGSYPPPAIDSSISETQSLSMSTATLGRPGRWESEAGPSRPPVERSPPFLSRAPSSQPPPHMGSDGAEQRAIDAARKGKAPVTGEEEEEEDPPFPTPVERSYLQPLPTSDGPQHPLTDTECLISEARGERTDAARSDPALKREDGDMETDRPTWVWACKGDREDHIEVDSDQSDGENERESRPPRRRESRLPRRKENRPQRGSHLM